MVAANGASQPTESKYDPNFTQSVIDSMGPKTGDRARLVMSSLIRHLHDFIREIELTPEEWMAGVQFINTIGQDSIGKRNEGQRVSDILGVESLVDEISSKAAVEDGDHPTSSTILGPFWSPHAPFRNLGDSIIQDPDRAGHTTFMHGTVTDVKTKKPIANAVVDIWQASASGEYDLNDSQKSENNLRGKFRTNQNGEYYLYCYHPTAYSIPTDGAAGALLKVLDRHPMRTAHIHVMVTAEGYRSLTTQLFPRDDTHISDDTVFAVKEDLILDFTPSNDPKAELDLKYDFTLAPLMPGQKQSWSHTVFSSSDSNA